LLNIFKVDFPYQVLHVTRRRFALSLFYCQLLCAPATFSQRSFTSFGTLSDFNLGYRPSGLAVGSAEPSRVEIALLAPEQPSVNLYEVSSSGRISQTASLKTQKTFRYIVASDLDGDGISEYVALSSGGNSVSILKRSSNNRFEEYEVSLPASVQKCVVADLNNDKRKDILLFGKNTAGVETLLGQPNGTFKLGTTLFSDISVSDLCTTDINADGITDILALNWLSNQLTVFYGISRFVYTEQVAVQLPSQPAEIAITNVTNLRGFRVAVTLPEASQVQVYSGNSLGDYRLMNTIAFDRKPAGVQFAHVNGDELLDLVSSTNQGIVVVLGASPTTFTQPVVFGAAHSIASWSVADVDGDGRNDCVLADQNTKRLITLANADHTGKVETIEYCVGASPQGLVIGDFNGNGREDIGVVNAASSNLSILLNRGRAKFSGQLSLQLPETPTYVRLVSSAPRKEKTLITSHSEEDKVTVVSFGEDILRSRIFSVPTGADPFVVSAKQDTTTLQFLVRYRSTKDKSFRLSSFEQINQRQFVERSLRATLPTKIIALTMDEGVSAGTYELLFATNDMTTKHTTVSLGVSESGLEFKTTKPLFSFADSTASTKFIIGRFVNNDPFKDVVVSLGAPRNELGIWYGKAPTVTRDSIQWIRNVQPTSDDAIIVKDVNGDNVSDITLLDALRRAVVVMYGTERRGFKQPTVIVPAEGVHSIRIAVLRESGVYDLVMSNPERGTVSIIMNPFNR